MILSTKGASNVFLGSSAGRNNVSGNNNVFIGDDSGKFNVVGRENVFVGSQAGEDSTSSRNVFVGSSSGNSTTNGSNNVFVGADSGGKNTTGDRNVFIGDEAGADNTAGFNNVFIGFGAGENNTSGDGNIYIGRGAGPTLSTFDQLFIDNRTGNFPLIHGNFSTDVVTINGDLRFTGSCPGCSSDMNLKQNVDFLHDPLASVLALRAISFDWIEGARENESLPGRQVGLIAQDVEREFPELVGTDGRGLKFVRYQKLVAPLIGAVKQQQETIEALKDLICSDRPEATLCRKRSF